MRAVVSHAQSVRGTPFDSPSVWTRLAGALQAAGDLNGAIAMYQEVLTGAAGHGK